MEREQTIAVWDGGVRMRVLSAGAGPALVFLLSLIHISEPTRRS